MRESYSATAFWRRRSESRRVQRSLEARGLLTRLIEPGPTPEG